MLLTLKLLSYASFCQEENHIHQDNVQSHTRVIAVVKINERTLKFFATSIVFA